MQTDSDDHTTSYSKGTVGGGGQRGFPGSKVSIKADNSPPTSAEITDVWSYTSATPICLQGKLSF